LPERSSNNTGFFLSVVNNLLKETWSDTCPCNLLLRPLYLRLYAVDDQMISIVDLQLSEAPSISLMKIEPYLISDVTEQGWTFLSLMLLNFQKQGILPCFALGPGSIVLAPRGIPRTHDNPPPVLHSTPQGCLLYLPLR
jgi:hypothetical protein